MRIRLMLVLPLFCLFTPAMADPVADLHAAEVAVADQSSATRAAALRDALAQVLVKLTGTSEVLESEAATSMLGNAGRFLQQYRYRTIEPPPTDPEAPRLALRADFDGRALERNLRAAGLPLWGRERPMTLVWIARDDAGGRELLGARQGHAEADALSRAAQRRGLPMRLPVMDAEDATRVSFMDVWGVFEEPLLEAAARYAPDAVLAGNIFQAGDDLWAGRWTLLRDGMRQRWEVSGESPEAVVNAAVDALAEHFSREFAVAAPLAGGDGVAMLIENVRSLEDYSRVLSYLGNLSVVKAAHLVQVDGETLQLRLELNGTSRALEQTIALGRQLEPVAEPVRESREISVPLGMPVDDVEEIDAVRERVLRYRYSRR